MTIGNGDHPSQPQAPQTPIFLPVPHAIMVSVQEGPVPEANLVIEVINNPMGQFIMAYPPEEAEQIGKELIAKARHARTGLTIVGEMPDPIVLDVDSSDN